MNIQLPTGNTISISAYEFFFLLKEEDVEQFYQSCIADNLGEYMDNPFSNKIVMGKLEVDDIEE